MEDNKFRKFYIDWWSIRKSTIYGGVALIVLVLVASVGGWWASRNNWFAAQVVTDAPKDAARIISFEGDVRITRAATRETIVVTKETYVAAGDTIQTQSDGRATVRMIDGSVYSVRPNSTVVVRDSSSLFGGQKIRVALDDGQINVRTDKQPEDTQNIVEVAESENKLHPDTDASFNADAQTNGGEIRISRGGVETTMGGQTTTINENEFAAVDNGNITSREKLLEPPKPNSPANAAQVVDQSGSGVNMTFNWQDSGAVSYYLQVSKSPYFAADTILVDRGSLTAREFRLSSLSPGTYYWRIRGTAKSGQTTNWNDPWKFTVVRGGGGRPIDVSGWNIDSIGGNVYIINGVTQPGAVVRSQGREVFAAGDGSFHLQISSGSAVAAVEVNDDKGNRSGFVLSLRNSTVTRRY
jgi:hypothetical protein